MVVRHRTRTKGLGFFCSLVVLPFYSGSSRIVGTKKEMHVLVFDGGAERRSCSTHINFDLRTSVLKLEREATWKLDRNDVHELTTKLFPALV